MRYKTSLLILLSVTVITILVNSCKKDNRTTVTSLFSGGRWQLASELVTVTNGTTTLIDTLNLKCDSTQVFTFNTDKTCTYTNFDCVPQKKSGTWSLSTDQLTLNAVITCADTTAAKSSKPFLNAQVVNLGDYSLVIQTGDYNVIPTSLNKTRTVRYGFVRQKTIN